MEVFRPGAVVLQMGADSLSGDKLGGFNLTLKGEFCFRVWGFFVGLWVGYVGCVGFGMAWDLGDLWEVEWGEDEEISASVTTFEQGCLEGILCGFKIEAGELDPCGWDLLERLWNCRGSVLGLVQWNIEPTQIHMLIS